jgi:hypothetical protein
MNSSGYEMFSEMSPLRFFHTTKGKTYWRNDINWKDPLNLFAALSFHTGSLAKLLVPNCPFCSSKMFFKIANDNSRATEKQ